MQLRVCVRARARAKRPTPVLMKSDGSVREREIASPYAISLGSMQETLGPFTDRAIRSPEVERVSIASGKHPARASPFTFYSFRGVFSFLSLSLFFLPFTTFGNV